MNENATGTSEKKKKRKKKRYFLKFTIVCVLCYVRISFDVDSFNV